MSKDTVRASYFSVKISSHNFCPPQRATSRTNLKRNFEPTSFDILSFLSLSFFSSDLFQMTRDRLQIIGILRILFWRSRFIPSSLKASNLLVEALFVTFHGFHIALRQANLHSWQTGAAGLQRMYSNIGGNRPQR